MRSTIESFPHLAKGSVYTIYDVLNEQSKLEGFLFEIYELYYYGLLVFEIYELYYYGLLVCEIYELYYYGY